MSNRSLRLLARAELDISAVLQLSLESWGPEQRDALATKIASALETLAMFPEVGRRRDDLGDGIRSFLIRPHAIYYRIDRDTVVILRVAHQRMDFRGRLEDGAQASP